MIEVRSAEDVRRINAGLDAQLIERIERIEPDQLNLDPKNGEWPLAQNLAHIGEFPRYFAADLRRWLADDSAEVGRTHEEANRLQAIESAPARDPAELKDDVREAFSELTSALESLEDADLERTMQNRKYGPEPLTKFLDRYILGHKAAHVRQLDETLAAIAGRKD
jgi:uncharacterized damage-inducible protein DinB